METVATKVGKHEVSYRFINPLYILPFTLLLEISRYIYAKVNVYATVRIAVLDNNSPPILYPWSRDGSRWISVGIGWIKKHATSAMIAELIAWRMTRNR